MPDLDKDLNPPPNPVLQPGDQIEYLPDGSSIAEGFNQPLLSEEAANDNDHAESDTAAKAKQSAARYLDESGFLINASNATIAKAKNRKLCFEPDTK